MTDKLGLTKADRERELAEVQENLRVADKMERAALKQNERLHEECKELTALLAESRDLLRHTKCRDEDATQCPACSLESRIDTLLTAPPKSEGP